MNINHICAKYLIGYSTAISILKEITDYWYFASCQEAKIRDTKLQQLHIKNLIDEFL